MLDIQLLRKDAALVAERLAARGFAFDAARFDALEAERKTIQTRTQDAQNRRNTLSKQIGMLKGKGEDTTAVMAEVAGLGDELKQMETRLAALQTEINDFLMGVPNLPHESVAHGLDETANVEVSRWGTPKTFDFPVRDHVDLGEGLGQLDFAAAVKITGSRFSVMKGGLARLHRALAQFMLDVHTAEHGYTEVYVPYLVNADSLRGTGNLPKFEEDLFQVPRPDADKLYLIPTAEVPVTNLLRDEIV
ncbi:MAG TPA: serine--tRNA ligase, partial [Thiobacillus sp.]|nr:serine--tRNA ligase [Thiobacillus sp.]